MYVHLCIFRYRGSIKCGIIVVQFGMSKLHYLCVGRDGIPMIVNSSDPCSRDLITDTLSAGAIVISSRLSFGVYFCRYIIQFTKALLPPWPHHSYPHS